MNTLSKQFNLFSILRYALPSTIAMLFTATFLIVDGFFVAQYIGETALSAINIVYPVISIIIAITVMFAAGGGALVAKYMGEDDSKTAKSLFTTINLLLLIIGVIITIVFTCFSKNIAYMLGGRDEILPVAAHYLKTLGFFSIPYIATVMSQSAFSLAGKPKWTLTVSLMGGVINAIFDYIFIVQFNLGITGAAVAAGLGYTIIFIIYLTFFINNKNGSLYFTSVRFIKKDIFKAITNGISEFITSISASVTTMLFNITMLQIIGNIGIASFTAIQYLQWLLSSVLLGFAYGVSPIIGFKYGEKNKSQLRTIFRCSIGIITTFSITTFLLAIFAKESMVSIFISETSPTFPISVEGMFISGFAYLFVGINMFASSMFTAYSNGKISGMLSIVRTVTIIVSILFLPSILGLFGINKIYGVWIATPLGEFLSFIIAIIMFFKYKHKYSL